MKATLVVFSAIASVLMASDPREPAPASTEAEARYVILMVPDGMGLSNVTATRIRLNGPAGAPLYMERLDRVGYARTFSEKNTVTDSSAAASAWACGEKFVNNEVCFHADGRPYNPTLLELAKRRGMSTGLVATQTITHATPASFAAHVRARKCETAIARQYVTDTQPDVMLGGGRSTFRPPTPDVCGDTGDYISAARAIGYTYVEDRDSMAAAAAGGATKLLGLFAGKNLTPEYQRVAGTREPRLPEMTAAALRVLERNQHGFFLLVEGSLVDSGNHAENLHFQTGEMRAFDEAVGVVLDWIAAHPSRRNHTMLLVLPDHETGGFAIIGSESPGAGLGPFTAGWAFAIVPPETEAHHTGTDVVFWSQGPGTGDLGRGIDNTDIYNAVKRALRIGY